MSHSIQLIIIIPVRRYDVNEMSKQLSMIMIRFVLMRT